MTYAARESSLDDGSPVFLYEFTDGTSAYRYCDLPGDITFDSNTWTAESIKHSEIKLSDQVSKNTIKITLPTSNAFAQLFIGWMPELSYSVTVYRTHIGETDSVVAFKGRITTPELNNNTIVFDVESVLTAIERNGINQRYLLNCRHVLYGNKCLAVKASFLVAGTLSAYSGLVLTISAASGYADNHFRGGIIEFPDGSFRRITAHSGSSITINTNNQYLVDTIPPYSVNLYPGCDKSKATCISKFNNVINFGGFPWIPTKNPISGSSIV